MVYENHFKTVKCSFFVMLSIDGFLRGGSFIFIPIVLIQLKPNCSPGKAICMKRVPCLRYAFDLPGVCHLVESEFLDRLH